jgi:hypothetical protein
MTGQTTDPSLVVPAMGLKFVSSKKDDDLDPALSKIFEN